MATAPRQASPQSNRSNSENFQASREPEPATVEESSGDVDLVSLLRQAAASGSKPLEAILDAVADAARVFSGADGTALGLETRGMIVCRARSGNVAPPLGAPISSESGISGVCLRTGAMLVCHDAMNDPRVDADVCRSLGIRSVAAIPVRSARGVAGILEAFAAKANAFDGDGLRSLRELAEIAETAYMREAFDRAIVPKPKPMSAVARPIVQPTPLPPLATEEIVDGLSQPDKRRLRWVAGIAAGLLLTVMVAWWSWHTPADETVSTTQNVRAASPQPTTPPPVHETSPKPGPGVSNSRFDRERSRPEIVKPAAERNPIDLRGDATTPNATAPIVLPNPDTIEVRIPKRAAGEAQVEEPPSVNLSPSADPEALAKLTSVTTPMPVAAPRVSQGVVEATLIRRFEPAYPLQARNQRLQGKVTLSVTISAEGWVKQVSVVNGSPILAAAAKAAVQQWQYHPAKLNGNPVEVQKEIIVLFAQP